MEYGSTKYLNKKKLSKITVYIHKGKITDNFGHVQTH